MGELVALYKDSLDAKTIFLAISEWAKTVCLEDARNNKSKIHENIFIFIAFI